MATTYTITLTPPLTADGFVDPKSPQEYADFNADAQSQDAYNLKANGNIRWYNLVKQITNVASVVESITPTVLTGATSITAPTSLVFTVSLDGDYEVKNESGALVSDESALKEVVAKSLTNGYSMIVSVWDCSLDVDSKNSPSGVAYGLRPQLRTAEKLFETITEAKAKVSVVKNS